jgi:hypothetical protein
MSLQAVFSCVALERVRTTPLFSKPKPLPTSFGEKSLAFSPPHASLALILAPPLACLWGLVQPCNNVLTATL